VADAVIGFQKELRRRVPGGCGVGCNAIHSTWRLEAAKRHAREIGALKDET
jgi:hypothetical protein